MSRRSGRLSIAILAILISLVWCENAWAYIDPSSGSYFLQMLLASLLGGLFALKVFWRRIKSFVVRLFSKPPRSDSSE
jgi:hypothetical protein